MSLLRDVLKRKAASGPSSDRAPGQEQSILARPLSLLSSKRSVKNYASSIKSTGGASMRSLAESMMSFYSMVTLGGTRVPKRRRPDFSTLGVPEWYAEDPPPAPLMPGTASASSVPAFFTRGNAGVLHDRHEGDKSWLGLVIYSHARADSVMPMYHNAAKVTGEVRLALENKANIGSIDVWVTIVSDSVLDILKPPILAMKANVWNRNKGHPTSPNGLALKGKFPTGTFVFPFEFPELPSDIIVIHPEDTKRRNKARVPLPPSFFISKVGGFAGSIKFVVGVNITFEGFGAVDDEYDMQFQYLPLCKPLPRLKTPFPYLPTREDWPYHRESIGGWSLTPFGGRGRLGEELVEIEGILGVQEPAVYTAGQIIEFSLLLWSPNALALEALGQPGAVEVLFCKSDLFALNVMAPRTSSRKNRYLEQLAKGRMWRTDNERPDDGAPDPEVRMVALPDTPPSTSAKKASPANEGSYRVKGTSSARMKEVWVEGDEFDAAATTVFSQNAIVDDTLEKSASKYGLDDGDDIPADEVTLVGTEPRAPSPTPSDEDLEAEDGQTDHFVRMDGEVHVPACSHPSFRYTNLGREYVVHLVFKHPQYSHVSPNASGIVAEFPVWYVLDRFAHLPPETVGAQMGSQDLSTLPINGPAIPVGPETVRLPLSVGVPTEERRPTSKFTRLSAF
ncbi:hypothetical protein B0H16DRAFT_1542622 [Mycena metata]|uniref:Arrestin-like N-terminal domain-containing protein n=1 Tax=Mycena metata TaxID=1033252 RepID=A0AAD7J2C9_9AGAR|nr:hypothetical protein B0H16DRAFT_1542622 [Mycena metata]